MKKFLWLSCILAVLTLNVAQAATVSFLNMKRPQDCPAFNEIAADLDTVRFPNDWKIYVACSDVTWKQVQSRGDVNGTDAAYTSRSKKFTVINAGMYNPTFDWSPYSQKTPQGALRHELGHITCDTGDEKTADKYADKGVCQ